MADDNTIEQLIQAMSTAAGAGNTDAANQILQSYASTPPPQPAPQSPAPQTPNLNVGASPQPPADLASSVPSPQSVAQNQTATQQNAIRQAMASRVPQPVPIIEQLFNPNAGVPKDIQGMAGYTPPSKLDRFENFLGNFLSAMSAGMQAAHGPGAALKGAGAAVASPYEKALQSYQLNQQAQLQQAQVGATGAETQARIAAMTQQPRFDPTTKAYIGNMTDAQYQQYIKGQGAAGVKGQSDINKVQLENQNKLTIAQMQQQVATGAVAHVYPHQDENGKVDGMMAYNKFNQPIGYVSGAVPPAVLFGSTKFTQNSDGSFSSVTTTPNVPGSPAAPGKPAPKKNTGVVPPAGSATPQQNDSFIAKMEASTNPIDVQARQVVNGDLTLDDVDAKTRGQVNAKASAYSLAKGLGPFNPRTGGANDPFGFKVGTDAQGKILSRKEIDSAQKTFNKDFVEPLQKTEGTFAQFQSILSDIDSGKDMTGAQSVVGLFNAIGISATPMKGMGFRINNNVIQEHAEARGLGQSLYQKLLSLKDGDVITPQQLRDYAQIAMQARRQQYVGAAQEAHREGLGADFLPRPSKRSQQIDSGTAQIYLDVAGGDPRRAEAAAQKAGWSF